MADWAAALAQGVAGAAGAEVGIADNQIRLNQQMDAEQRAADLKLAMDQRMAAARQMMEQQAMARFQNYLPDNQTAAPAPVTADGTAPAPASASGQAAPGAAATPAAPMSQWDQIKAGMRRAALEDPEAARVAAGIYTPMMEQDTKETENARKAKHDDGTMAIERDKVIEDARSNKADEDIERTKANKEKKSDDIPPSTKALLIHSEDANIKSATSELTMLSRQIGNIMGKSPDDLRQRDEINQRMSDLRDEIKESKANKRGYMQSLGILPADGSAPPSVPMPKGGTVPNPTGQGGGKLPSGLNADPLGLFRK